MGKLFRLLREQLQRLRYSILVHFSMREVRSSVSVRRGISSRQSSSILCLAPCSRILLMTMEFIDF